MAPMARFSQSPEFHSPQGCEISGLGPCVSRHCATQLTRDRAEAMAAFDLLRPNGHRVSAIARGFGAQSELRILVAERMSVWRPRPHDLGYVFIGRRCPAARGMECDLESGKSRRADRLRRLAAGRRAKRSRVRLHLAVRCFDRPWHSPGGHLTSSFSRAKRPRRAVAILGSASISRRLVPSHVS